MSLPPLPSCSNRGVGSTAFELGFASKEQWGSELTRLPMGETASVNLIARICKPSMARFVIGDKLSLLPNESKRQVLIKTS
jgi:hypothetical protein